MKTLLALTLALSLATTARGQAPTASESLAFSLHHERVSG